jgi:hypothetical protein
MRYLATLWKKLIWAFIHQQLLFHCNEDSVLEQYAWQNDQLPPWPLMTFWRTAP